MRRRMRGCWRGLSRGLRERIDSVTGEKGVSRGIALLERGVEQRLCTYSNYGQWKERDMNSERI